MGNGSVRVWGAAACLALWGSGCFDAPEARERLSQVKAEGAEIDRALDGIEERLLGNQALVHQWQELGRRHEKVSALACENVSGHVQEMARLLDAQQSRARRYRQAQIPAESERVSAAPVNGRKTRSN